MDLEPCVYLINSYDSGCTFVTKKEIIRLYLNLIEIYKKQFFKICFIYLNKLLCSSTISSTVFETGVTPNACLLA